MSCLISFECHQSSSDIHGTRDNYKQIIHSRIQTLTRHGIQLTGPLSELHGQILIFVNGELMLSSNSMPVMRSLNKLEHKVSVQHTVYIAIAAFHNTTSSVKPPNIHFRCLGHSWRVRLATQETLTPPGHLFSPLVCRGL